jgi:hypothetical protein
VGSFEPEQIEYLEEILLATQAKLQLKKKVKITFKDSLLHIFETSAKKDGITLNDTNEVQYNKAYIRDLRENLAEAKNGNQQADINLQNVFEKVADQYKFLPDPEDRHKYHKELIDWLEAVK